MRDKTGERTKDMKICLPGEEKRMKAIPLVVQADAECYFVLRSRERNTGGTCEGEIFSQEFKLHR